MPGRLLILNNPGVVAGRPGVPQTDMAVGANFERFDGLSQPPLDHPAGEDDQIYAGGFQTGNPDFGRSPRPGQMGQPLDQVYTPGAISGVVGTLGGQPLPVGDRIHRPDGDYTRSKWPTIQQRLGVGQKGPSSLGVANTVQLSEITNNPPVPGDLTSILAGLG